MIQNNMPILELENITKKYGDFHAVTSVNFSIYPGEFFTLLGPSGSGKTTILQMIAGFIQPTQGKIKLSGREISHIPPNKRNMGFVFQDYALFPHMNVFQNIAYPLKIRKMDKRGIKNAVEKTMELVQLRDFAHRKPSELSGGQQQRVALARALVFEPSLILMDEPLGALDKKLREHMQVEIKRVQEITGVTIVFVTHDQEEAMVMSDRIAVLNNSYLVQLGNPEELYETPVNFFVADFIGKNNFMKGIVESKENGQLTVRLNRKQAVTIDHESEDIKDNQSVYLSVRPERLTLEQVKEDTKIGEINCLIGNIDNVAYLGDCLKYTVRINDGNEPFYLSVVTQCENVFSKEQRVKVWWSPDHLKVFSDKGTTNRNI